MTCRTIFNVDIVAFSSMYFIAETAASERSCVLGGTLSCLKHGVILHEPDLNINTDYFSKSGCTFGLTHVWMLQVTGQTARLSVFAVQHSAVVVCGPGS